MAPVHVRLDPNKPIGEQLINEFTRMIATNEWKPGERVPSVRSLAVAFGVNPNTVQKALAALDEQGLLVAESTAGRFVTHDAELIESSAARLAGEHVATYAAQMRSLGISLQHSIDLLNTEWHSQQGS